MINIGTNLNYQGKDFLDKRKKVQLISDLKGYDSYVPEGFEVFCEEDGKWYIYREQIEDDITGHFISRDKDIYEGSIIEEKDTELKNRIDTFRDEAFPYSLEIKLYDDISEAVKRTSQTIRFNWYVIRKNTEFNKKAISDGESYAVTYEDDIEVKVYVDGSLIETKENKSTGYCEITFGSNNNRKTESVIRILLTVNGKAAYTYYKYIQYCSTGLIWAADTIPTETSFNKEEDNYLKYLVNNPVSSTTFSESIYQYKDGDNKYILALLPKSIFNKTTDSSYKMTIGGYETTSISVKPVTLTYGTYGTITENYLLFSTDYPVNLDKTILSVSITKSDF